MNWIKCSEQMPKEGETVIIFSEAWNWPVEAYLVSAVRREFWLSRARTHEIAEYWMPMPNPPKK